MDRLIQHSFIFSERIGTYIDLVGVAESSDAKCEKWYNDNTHLINNDTFNQMIDGKLY